MDAHGRVVVVADVGDARSTTMRDVDDDVRVRVRCGACDVRRVRNDDDDEGDDDVVARR